MAGIGSKDQRIGPGSNGPLRLADHLLRFQTQRVTHTAGAGRPVQLLSRSRPWCIVPCQNNMLDCRLGSHLAAGPSNRCLAAVRNLRPQVLVVSPVPSPPQCPLAPRIADSCSCCAPLPGPETAAGGGALLQCVLRDRKPTRGHSPPPSRPSRPAVNLCQARLGAAEVGRILSSAHGGGLSGCWEGMCWGTSVAGFKSKGRRAA